MLVKLIENIIMEILCLNYYINLYKKKYFTNQGVIEFKTLIFEDS